VRRKADMPSSPRATPRSVAPIGLPGATFQTPTRFLAESQVPGEQVSKFGAGMLRAGDELLSEATRQQIDLNEAAAKDYDAKLMGDPRDPPRNDPTSPDTGYLQAKGKDALDAFDATVQALNKLPADLSKDLQNPAQQDLVKHVAQLARAVRARARRRAPWAAERRLRPHHQRAAHQDGAGQRGAELQPDERRAAPQFDVDNPGANSPYQQACRPSRRRRRPGRPQRTHRPEGRRRAGARRAGQGLHGHAGPPDRPQGRQRPPTWRWRRSSSTGQGRAAGRRPGQGAQRARGRAPRRTRRWPSRSP
jgi:hypothetical protein